MLQTQDMRFGRLRRVAPASRLGLLACLAGAGVGLVVVTAWVCVAWMARGQIVPIADSPNAEVAIVPGARVRSDGRPTLALRQRLDAAAFLYDQGAVDHVLVSGDNGDEHYNEPVAMQRYLRALGLPAESITLDYAGFDTWDTCLRATEQFGVTDAVVVTQPRFAQRSAALCQRAGIDTTVATTDDYLRRTGGRLSADIRERLASVKALGDIVLTPDAHHGGPFVGLVGSDDDNL